MTKIVYSFFVFCVAIVSAPLAYGQMQAPLVQNSAAAQGNAVKPYCREFDTTVTIDGKVQHAYGTTCEQPDGTWKIQPQNPNSTTPPQQQPDSSGAQKKSKRNQSSSGQGSSGVINSLSSFLK